MKLKKKMLLSIETPSSSKLPSPKNVIVWCQSYGNIEILLFIRKISFCDILFRNMSRIFSPINFILSVPLTTLCTDGIWKSVCFFNWYGIVSLNWKISSKFEELYLCYWVETRPSLSRSSSKFFRCTQCIDIIHAISLFHYLNNTSLREILKLRLEESIH